MHKAAFSCEKKKTNSYSECSLEHIEHINEELPSRIPHNTSVELSCNYKYSGRKQVNRTCNFDNWVPNFYSSSFLVAYLYFDFYYNV